MATAAPLPEGRQRGIDQPSGGSRSNGTEKLYALLKRGAADIERQVQSAIGRLQESHDLRDQCLERRIATNQFCFWKAVLKVAHECVGVVVKRDGAHRLFCGCD